MAKWSIYAEVCGYPVYSQVEVENDMDESEVWDYVYDDISQTLEVTKED